MRDIPIDTLTLQEIEAFYRDSVPAHMLLLWRVDAGQGHSFGSPSGHRTLLHRAEKSHNWQRLPPPSSDSVDNSFAAVMAHSDAFINYDRATNGKWHCAATAAQFLTWWDALPVRDVHAWQVRVVLVAVPESECFIGRNQVCFAAHYATVLLQF